MGDFRREILHETAHRPWPMPRAPWVMTQTWHDLLFAHWPMDPSALAATVPPGLRLDTHEGRAWLGIVPFRMSNVAPRGFPALPGLSAFPELNVRTYVRAGGRPGVYFFSLDASSALAVAVARRFFRLPYFTAAMTVGERAGWIEYRSRRADRTGAAAELDARYRPAGAAAPPVPGTLEHFLTERYCLFNTDARGRVYTVDIHHPPWPLQPAEAEIRANSMADAAGIALPPGVPLLHFSKRQDMVAWPLVRARETP